MRLGALKIYTTTSNSTITLSYSNPFVLYNIKILALNPKMNLTIKVTNPNGDSWSFPITSGTEITFKKVNYQSISFNDPNNYTIYYTLQAIYAGCQQELLKLEQESDIAITPISSVIISSPIDSFGNVMVSVNKIFSMLTSSQNWTVPTGVYRVKIIAIAGGGGGGGGSANYAGGGGGAGAISYAEAQVNPGDVLNIQVGGGGSPGTGGSTPTAGGNGGSTQVLDPAGNVIVKALGGGGGQPGGTSAAGVGGGGGESGGIGWGVQSNRTLFALSYAGQNGVSGSGTTPGGLAFTPVLFPPEFPISSNTLQASYNNPASGYGGNGGNPNGNGGAGGNGVVMIWWGD